jgi:hypothetical protein
MAVTRSPPASEPQKKFFQRQEFSAPSSCIDTAALAAWPKVGRVDPAVIYISFCMPRVRLFVPTGRHGHGGIGRGRVAACIGALDRDCVDAVFVVFFMPTAGFLWNQIVVVVVRVGALWAGFCRTQIDVMRVEDDPVGSIISLVAGDTERADRGTAAARCCSVADVNFDEPVIRGPDVIWIGTEVIDVGANDAWCRAGV